MGINTALDIRETINTLAEEKTDISLLFASQLADKAVEILGIKSGVMHIYFSATPEETISPTNSIESLIRACCYDVQIDIKEQVSSFFRRFFSESLKYSKGTLITIIKPGFDYKNEVTQDGVFLEKPIDISELVQLNEIEKNDESYASLVAYTNLISGMLACDGILLINTVGQVLGYNHFIKSDSTETSQNFLGGARHRAFSTLCKMVDGERVFGCFILSTDGSSRFFERHNNE